MTAKQKKNLRKKLYRKRKKLEQSHNNSKLDLTNESFQTSENSRSSANEDDEESKAEEEPDLNIDIEDVAVAIGDKPKPIEN